MKKYVLGVLALCSASWGGVDENCSNAKLEYSGWYAGLGINYQYDLDDITLDDNLGYVAAMRAVITHDAHHVRLNKKNKGKIGGTVNLGYGDFIDSNCYLGADLTADISGNRESSETNNQSRVAIPFNTTTVKNTGTVPTLALRLGAYIPSVDTLVYARFGAALVNSKINVNLLRYQIKNNKITPILGLGFEKNIFNHCSLKLEADYRFPSKKNVSDVNAVHITNNYHASVDTKVRGYVVRVVGVYHF